MKRLGYALRLLNCWIKRAARDGRCLVHSVTFEIAGPASSFVLEAVCSALRS